MSTTTKESVKISLKKPYICILMYTHCCIAETNTALWNNYTPIFFFKLLQDNVY